MRRFISFILIISLIIMPLNSALANDLKLPKALREINKEAFAYDESIQHVILPYGATEIGARAFADSGIETIYIPDTVQTIAADAFAGADDVIIYAPAESTAAIFAEEHDYLWQDSGNTYQYEQFQEMQEIYGNIDDEEYNASFDQMTFDPIDVGDAEISDEVLLIIEEYNAAQEELASMVQNYSAGLNSAYEGMESIGTLMENSPVEFSDEGVSYSTAGFSYSINNTGLENLGPDMEILSTENIDGCIRLKVRSGSDIYYIDGDINGLSLSGMEMAISSATSDPQVFAELKMASAYTYSSRAVDFSDIYDALYNEITNISIQLRKMESDIKALWEEAEAILAKKKSQLLTIEKLVLDPGDISDPKVLETLQRNWSIASLEYKPAEAPVIALRKALAIVGAINPAMTISSIASDYQKWRELGEIEAHGHPLDSELEDIEKTKLIEQMLDECAMGRTVYVCNIANNVVSLLDDISTLIALVGTITGAGAAVGWAQKAAVFIGVNSVRAMITSICIGVVCGTTGTVLYDSVMEADKTLHGGLYGYVTDSLTGDPVKRAAISFNGATAYTDSSGYYRVSIPNGAHEVTFSKSKYFDKTEEVTMVDNLSLSYDIEMEPKAVLTGIVTDGTTGKPIAGATVDYGWYRTTTNEEGRYNFDVAPGTEILKVTMDGYAPYEAEATCERLTTITHDVNLTPDPMSGEYRVVLTWKADQHMRELCLYENYFDTGIYSMSSSGRASLTLNVDPTQTYQIDVYRYFSDTDEDTSPPSFSPETLTIYKDSEVIATFKTTSGGFQWPAIRINYGVLAK